MNKINLLIALIISSPCFGMQEKVKFNVFDGNEFHKVKRYDIDPVLRRMNSKQLKGYLEQGCRIRAVKLSNGDYVVRAHVPGLGGGPILGAITAAVSYTVTGIAAVGTMVGVTIVTGGNLPAGMVAGAAVGKAGCEVSLAATIAATASPSA